MTEVERFSIIVSMESHSAIIVAWGRKLMAKDLRVPAERVRGWERQNSLPAGYWKSLLEKAPARNIAISPDLLIDLAAKD